MKLVTAIIQPPKLKAVIAALKQAGVERLTVCEAQGYGQQRGRSPMFRGNEYHITFLRKVVLEIVVNDDFLDRTIHAITTVARSGPEGDLGDGKIFVLPVAESIQIGTRTRGQEAV